jgi:hypothetical protein
MDHEIPDLLGAHTIRAASALQVNSAALEMVFFFWSSVEVRGTKGEEAEATYDGSGITGFQPLSQDHIDELAFVRPWEERIIRSTFSGTNR